MGYERFHAGKNISGRLDSGYEAFQGLPADLLKKVSFCVGPAPPARAFNGALERTRADSITDSDLRKGFVAPAPAKARDGPRRPGPGGPRPRSKTHGEPKAWPARSG